MRVLFRLTVTFLCNCAHLFRCFLSPICLVHLTVTFLSKLRLLVLSYLATKVSLLGNVICLGVARLCSITVSLTVFCIFFFFYLFYFLNIGFGFYISPPPQVSNSHTLFYRLWSSSWSFCRSNKSLSS